jgi:hypothetical protein
MCNTIVGAGAVGAGAGAGAVTAPAPTKKMRLLLRLRNTVFDILLRVLHDSVPIQSLVHSSVFCDTNEIICHFVYI